MMPWLLWKSGIREGVVTAAVENLKAGILQSFGGGGRWNDCVQNIPVFVPFVANLLLRS
jgi:hypothetical protein